MKKYDTETYNYYLQLDGFEKYKRIFVILGDPIYHPSPIKLKGYKNNVDIFETIKRKMNEYAR